jgi:hypothetical protein
MERNWTGLLIEPSPKAFAELVAKNRKAYALNSCLSLNETSSQMDFIEV